MIRDDENTFSKRQDLTGKSAKTASTDVIQTGVGDAVLPPWFRVQATTQIAAGSAGNVTVILETATDEAFTSPVTLVSKQLTLPVAVGEILEQRLPKGNLGYLRAAYTPSVVLTGGAVTAALYVDVDM